MNKSYSPRSLFDAPVKDPIRSVQDIINFYGHNPESVEEKPQVGLCYQCKEKPMNEDDHPFCSPACHQNWIKENETQPKRGEPKSISYIQKRLRQFGREAKHVS